MSIVAGQEQLNGHSIIRGRPSYNTIFVPIGSWVTKRGKVWVEEEDLGVEGGQDEVRTFVSHRTATITERFRIAPSNIFFFY